MSSETASSATARPAPQSSAKQWTTQSLASSSGSGEMIDITLPYMDDTVSLEWLRSDCLLKITQQDLEREPPSRDKGKVWGLSTSCCYVGSKWTL